MKISYILLIGLLVSLCIAPVSADNQEIFSFFDAINPTEKSAQGFDCVDVKTAVTGEWYQKKSIPFLASGEGRLTFYEDGTADLAGAVTIFGKNRAVEYKNLHWEYLAGETFLGTYGEYQTLFTLSDDTLRASVNPYQLKLVPYKIFDFTIPVAMNRVL